MIRDKFQELLDQLPLMPMRNCLDLTAVFYSLIRKGGTPSSVHPVGARSRKAWVWDQVEKV